LGGVGLKRKDQSRKKKKRGPENVFIRLPINEQRFKAPKGRKRHSDLYMGFFTMVKLGVKDPLGILEG